MNYTELVTQVNDYCENSFPTDNMNVFIRQAEQRIYNTAQPANLRKNVTGILTTGNKYLVNVIVSNSQLIQQNLNSCSNSGFCKLKLADVLLCD